MTGTDIRIWMIKQNLKAKKIATEYGCKPSFISKFLKGDKASQDLVVFMIDKGCPKKYFKNGRVAA